MGGIFISYRREDSAGWAGRLYDHLTVEFGGAQVFMDVDNIQPGEDFVDAIHGTLDRCDVALAVIGPRWASAVDERGVRRLENEGDFVAVEIATALERGIRVIPVLVDAAVMPAPTDLPERLARLTRRMAVSLSAASFRRDVADLTGTLQRVVVGSEAPPAAAPASAPVGDVFGDYRLLDLLGDGAFWDVHLAERIQGPGSRYAIKILSRELSEDEEARRRFRREALLARDLPTHPNIVEVVDAGVAEDRVFIVMAHVDGDDLEAQIAADGPLSLQASVRLVTDVAAGLSLAHRHGLVHGNLVARTIITRAADEVALVNDFGFTKRNLQGQDQQGHPWTSSPYLAPEVVADGMATHRSDLYSLGAVLHLCLTGEPPASDPGDRPANPVSAARPDLPSSLDLIVARALAAEPDERFQTGAEIAEALHEVLWEQAADSRPAHPRVPTIPGYDGLVEIGRGTAARVYRARQAALGGREVAIKVIGGVDADEAVRRRFERECAAVGRLSGHPNVVSAFDAGFVEDDAYLVMEYLPGGSFDDVLRRDGPMVWSRVVELGAGVADALAEAHATGLVHRDVKPKNVLIGARGQAKLADFGIAFIEGRTRSRTGMFSASILHAAPEILDGERASAATDLYALGSTLFTLLAGQAPFVGDDENDMAGLIERIRKAPVPDLRPRGVPDAVCGILERSLAKVPEERWSSGLELSEALDALADAEP